jgi:hypothetical protein
MLRPDERQEIRPGRNGLAHLPREPTNRGSRPIRRFERRQIAAGIFDVTGKALSFLGRQSRPTSPCPRRQFSASLGSVFHADRTHFYLLTLRQVGVRRQDNRPVGNSADESHAWKLALSALKTRPDASALLLAVIRVHSCPSVVRCVAKIVVPDGGAWQTRVIRGLRFQAWRTRFGA